MKLLGSPKVIGELYAKAHDSHCSSVELLIEAGRLLGEVREELPHGEWMIWCHEHKEALGFDDRTARRLIQAYKLSTANWPSTSNLEPSQALAISRRVWNNLPDVPETEDTRTAAFKQITKLLEWMARHPAQEVAKELFYAETAEVRDKISDALEWLAWLERYTRSNGRKTHGIQEGFAVARTEGPG